MAEFPPLDCSKILFRAVLNPKWITKDGKLKWQNFKRRTEKDKDGVSLFFSPADATSELSEPVAGMASVHVGLVRDCPPVDESLDVVQDQVNHAVITGIPFPLGSGDEANYVVVNADMIKLCKEIAEKAGRILS